MNRDDTSQLEQPIPPREPPAINHQPQVAPPDAPQPETAASTSRHSVSLQSVWMYVGIAAAALLAVWGSWSPLKTAFISVSTDDAYVNGHVTFLAPRVPGQVTKVLVDNNYRVKKGDILVQLDPEPYRIAVEQKQAAVVLAEADLVAANAQVRALVGQTQADRYELEYVIEMVDNKIAGLQASVATHSSRKADMELARINLVRAEKLVTSGAISQQELDVDRQTFKADEANVDEALQLVRANRSGLGLSLEPPEGKELSYVPMDLDQSFATVREALAKFIESSAQLGYVAPSIDTSPKHVLADFDKQDASGDLDRIYAALIPNAPPIRQAEAKLLQAKRDLDQAKLNLRYCTVVSDIDGVITSRNVNPGNNVQAGQTLMAVRSLSEIWIDANFKETQLSYLRIGQRAVCEVDMYGRKQAFEGRITGFTMGTGQTLALLPPQNATGNFVKIVQRLPVRIELTNYDADQSPLFVGLSVTPYVYFKEPPSGPNAGQFLQPNAPLPQGSVDPTPSTLMRGNHE
ncbi:putative multidrug resistance protein EmrK [Anatilimnocola aggregata]|uniref:Putative multidrug resistance protein EmrK n=1 Tax=Anatilimnocola aggregata TaxID=2528021 RepID=A0A517Y7F6_9BACT|nr:HlyD family secretion protein [Anatilimnocola aggregata]QDU26174.1 putative multidrug resistance protein EmrK [Anatilimnocola aggregata]